MMEVLNGIEPWGHGWAICWHGKRIAVFYNLLMARTYFKWLEKKGKEAP